ncbi:hypothetical protein [Roseitalea porphyridii]|uniref:Uncharacterized protein n=1 Tax=Roseitalea porphyridii TaxID=1852022 RepID=A0A4P6V0G0_9HYPH|nr:hypothetical protein [Roseitalea porphyridii]QBK29800.1 hypothetical protein E0E05_03800 [Roseitalea porphyridii]
MTDHKTKEDKAIPDEPRLPARPTLTLDVALYQEYLDDAELSAEQKQEFIETLWNIIVAFVDLGFGIDSVQTVLDEAEHGDDVGALPTISGSALSEKFDHSRDKKEKSGKAVQP